MKRNKLLALALALTMALALTACGGGDKPAETPAGNSNISAETPDANKGPVITAPIEDETVETPEQPEEPEVPSEIEIVTGETYSIENLFDITFGELEYESIILGDYPTDYQYRVYINLPATITITGSETLDPFNKAFYENFTKRGYSDDGKEEFTLGMYFAGTNKLDKFEPGNTYELEMESDTFYEGVSTGTIKVNAFGKIFTMPYDYAEVLVPPTE